MSIFSLLKSKIQRESEIASQAPEDFELPELSRKEFPMTEALRRRQEDEGLKHKYGVPAKKEGDFI